MDGRMGRVVVHLSQCVSVTADRPARSHRRECAPALSARVPPLVTLQPLRHGRVAAWRPGHQSGAVPRASRGGAEHDEAEARMWALPLTGT